MHCTNPVSLDHLVGAAEQRWRDVDAELFCRLEIDYQFELRRLFDGQISGLRAFQDSVHVVSSASPMVGEAWPIGYEAAGFNVFRGAGTWLAGDFLLRVLRSGFGGNRADRCLGPRRRRRPL